MKKIILLVLLVFLMSGCAFKWNKRMTVGAKGAKAKVYGELESGELLYESSIFFNFGCWRIK